jgi:hypothetical protein
MPDFDPASITADNPQALYARKFLPLLNTQEQLNRDQELALAQAKPMQSGQAPVNAPSIPPVNAPMPGDPRNTMLSPPDAYGHQTTIAPFDPGGQNPATFANTLANSPPNPPVNAPVNAPQNLPPDLSKLQSPFGSRKVNPPMQPLPGEPIVHPTPGLDATGQGSQSLQTQGISVAGETDRQNASKQQGQYTPAAPYTAIPPGTDLGGGQKASEGMVAVPLPKTPEEADAISKHLQERMKAIETLYQQATTYHPSVGKRILMGALGALVGIKDPMAAFNMTQQALEAPQLRQAQQQEGLLKSELEMYKTNAEMQKAQLEAQGQGALAQQRMAAAQNQLAQANLNRLRADPGWAARMAIAQSAGKPMSAEQAGVRWILDNAAKSGTNPQLQDFINLKKSLGTARPANPYDTWYNTFTEENGRKPTSEEINKEQEFIKRDPAAAARANDAAIQRSFDAYDLAFRSYQEKMTTDRDNANQALASLKQHTQEGDAAAVEQILSIISRRMSQPGIDFILHGGTFWTNLEQLGNMFKKDPNGTRLPDVQRAQLEELARRYVTVEDGNLGIIADGYLASANPPGGPAEIRNIEARTKKTLSKIGLDQLEDPNLKPDVGKGSDTKSSTNQPPAQVKTQPGVKPAEDLQPGDVDTTSTMIMNPDGTVVPNPNYKKK